MAWKGEDLLILSLSRLRPPQGSLKEEEASNLLKNRDLLERAAQHGLGGLLYSALRGWPDPGEKGEEGLKLLRKAYHSTLAANLHMMREFGKLAETLQGESIPFLVVQGAALLPTLYGRRLALRPLGDLDILIPEGDMTRARRMIRHEGYRSADHYPNLFCKRGVVLDVHSDPLNSDRLPVRRRLASSLEERLWRNAIPLKDDLMGSIMIPAPCDHFLLLSLHAIKHSFSRWIWAVDLAEMLTSFILEGSAGGLVRAADETNLQKPLLYTVLYLKKAFGLEVPDGMIDGLPEAMGIVEKRVVGMVVNDEPLPRSGDLLYLCSLERPVERVSFVWETLVPRRRLMARAAAARRKRAGPSFFASRAVEALSTAGRLGLRLVFRGSGHYGSGG